VDSFKELLEHVESENIKRATIVAAWSINVIC
jgi:hypothetical protein